MTEEIDQAFTNEKVVKFVEGLQSSCVAVSQEKCSRFYGRVCSFAGLGYSWYVLILGIIGTLVTICDILQLTEGGTMVTDNLWRNRMHRGTERIVSPETERDMKLMASILNMEHYVLLVFGVMHDSAVLLMPWLLMEGMVIALEAFLFGMRLFIDGFSMNRSEVFMSGIVIHNWFQVFCYFRKKVACCSL